MIVTCGSRRHVWDALLGAASVAGALQGCPGMTRVVSRCSEFPAVMLIRCAVDTRDCVLLQGPWGGIRGVAPVAFPSLSLGIIASYGFSPL